jgi:hypothetical protein
MTPNTATRPTPMQWAAHQLTIAANPSDYENYATPPRHKTRAKEYSEKVKSYEPRLLDLLKAGPTTATQAAHGSRPTMQYYVVCEVLRRLTERGLVTAQTAKRHANGTRTHTIYSLKTS